MNDRITLLVDGTNLFLFVNDKLKASYPFTKAVGKVIEPSAGRPTPLTGLVEGTKRGGKPVSCYIDNHFTPDWYSGTDCIPHVIPPLALKRVEMEKNDALYLSISLGEGIKEIEVQLPPTKDYDNSADAVHRFRDETDRLAIIYE